MLETYRAAYDPLFNDKIYAPSAGRNYNAVVLTSNNNTATTSSFEQQQQQFSTTADSSCIAPQPWRPTSPTFVLKKKPSKRCITTEEREREACLEIQQILFQQAQAAGGGNQTPSVSSSSNTPFTTDASIYPIERPSTNRSLYFNLNTPSIGNEPNNVNNGNNDGIIRNNDSDNNVSLHNEGEDFSLRDSTHGLRLVLSHSPAPRHHHHHHHHHHNQDVTGRSTAGNRDGVIPNDDDDLIDQDDDEDSIDGLSSFRAVTPPIRSHNPITMNSPFCYGTGCEVEGAEIGLLSFSPPLLSEYLPSQMDRRFKITSSPNTNDYYNKRRFGDAGGSSATRLKQQQSLHLQPAPQQVQAQQLPPQSQPQFGVQQQVQVAQQHQQVSFGGKNSRKFPHLGERSFTTLPNFVDS